MAHAPKHLLYVPDVEQEIVDNAELVRMGLADAHYDSKGIVGWLPMPGWFPAPTSTELQ